MEIAYHGLDNGDKKKARSFTFCDLKNMVWLLKNVPPKIGLIYKGLPSTIKIMVHSVGGSLHIL